MLDNITNQSSKFGTKNWVEGNDNMRVRYNTSSQIEFKTSMVKPSFSDYSDAYILVKGTITITGDGPDNAAKRLVERNKGVIFKNCALSTD